MLNLKNNCFRGHDDRVHNVVSGAYYSKAFDTLDHCMVLEKLQKMNFANNVYNNEF